MSRTASTAIRPRAGVVFSALFLSAVAWVAGSAASIGHGAGASGTRPTAVSMVVGVLCTMCGG